MGAWLTDKGIVFANSYLKLFPFLILLETALDRLILNAQAITDKRLLRDYLGGY